MSVFEAIVLGITQGLTEFLPISSTAHLRIVPAFAGWEDPGAAFTAVVQLGTMVAVLLYFREDLWRIARGLAAIAARRGGCDATLDARLGWYIVLGTIPIGIFGLIFKDQIENGARDLYLIAIALIVFGLVLLAAEEVGTKDALDRADQPARRRRHRPVRRRWRSCPGVSRSGATISAGLFRGLDRPSAARYSFLLSVPAVVLSGLFELKSIVDGSEHVHAGAGALIIATVLAFVVGYWSIAFLLRYVAPHSMIVFVVYRVALGSLVLVLVSTGVIH